MKVLAIGLISATLVFLLASAFLPKDYSVERELLIAAEIEELYATVEDLSSWPEWSAWSREADPEAEWLFTGKAGVGKVMQWDGPTLGKGRLEIVETTPPKKLVYILTMPDGSLSSRGVFTFEEQGAKTRVRWQQTGDLPGIRMRWVGLFFDGWLGDPFAQSLRGLKGRFVDEI